MKLLLDQGLPRSAAGLLRNAGIDTVHTGEIGYAAANDADILECARVEARIMDKSTTYRRSMRRNRYR